jgi:hypothetical protein
MAQSFTAKAEGIDHMSATTSTSDHFDYAMPYYDDKKLSLRARAATILGLSLMLWAIILTPIFLLLS